MRRRSLTYALLPLLLAAAPAEAATVHVVRGAGFGHGIGLSQYGAYGYARHGASHREILAHYYRGTALGSAGDRTIRVLLQSGRSEIRFRAATRVPGHRLNPRRTYRARSTGLSSVELRTIRGRLVGRFDSPLSVTSARGWLRLLGTGINGLRDARYRGALEVRRNVFGRVSAINAAGLDDYVQGVVPGEMPSSWAREALEAQAVVARSYALATDAGGSVFDQYPDTRSQVYRGMSGEDGRTNAAVRATAGQVLRYGGRIAVTYYFSTSGGRTENVENVFYKSRPVPYLVSVSDPYDGISPKHRWTFRFTTRQMQARLRGLVKGRFRSIEVVRRGVSPRVVWAFIRGSRGRTRVRGATLRTRLGLFDTWAYFRRIRRRRDGGRDRPSRRLSASTRARQEKVSRPAPGTAARRAPPACRDCSPSARARTG